MNLNQSSGGLGKVDNSCLQITWACFSKGLAIFQAQRQILDSKPAGKFRSRVTNHSIWLCELIVSLYHCQTYLNFDVEYQHDKHKTTFQA